MEALTGAEILIRALKAAGVECVFMKEHPETEPIEEAIATEGSVKLTIPVSESSCVPMADAYTRCSGKPAAAITAGGGHLMNQIIGVASAWSDKSPVISIGVGQPRSQSCSPIFDRENWDQKSVFEAVSRWTARANEWHDIPEVVFRGVREALSGRQGPVHIEIPRDLLKQREEFEEQEADRLQAASFYAQEQSPPRGDAGLVRVAFELLRNAKKPLIFAGGGVVKSEAAEAINELADKFKIPLITSMGGTGLADPDSFAYIGPSSYLSGEAFHTAIKEADVVLAIGCCFSGLDGFGLPPLWSAKIKFIQVNIDPEDIALNPPAEVAIVGDAKQVIGQLLEMASKQPDMTPRSSWISRLKVLNLDHIDRIVEEASRDWDKIHPANVPPILNDIIGDSDTIVVLDGGNTVLWAGILVPVPGPRRGLFPFGMGTLGLGIPGSIGAKVAEPDKPVVIITGDGAFLYNIQELETIRKYDLPIMAVIFNDSAWNMMRAGQAMTGEVYGTDLPSQDYAAVAESYGIKGIRVTRIEEIGPAFKEAVESGKAAVIDVVVDPDCIPDSLISFARVEFDKVNMPPAKLIKGLRKSSVKFDIRLWNLIKFIRKTR